MDALSGSEFVSLWEQGCGLHALDQGLLALAAAEPGVSWEKLAELPLGHRNRALAEMRMILFGSRLRGWAPCSECGEKMEFELDCMDLIATAHDPHMTVVVDGQAFRLPNTRDLAAASREADPQAAERTLIDLCRIEMGSRRSELSPEEIETIGKQMAQADPLAELRIEIACSQCGRVWDEALDLAGFLWAEIEVQVRRLLMDVHALASAYGWSEREILSMSDERRALYLEMVRA